MVPIEIQSFADIEKEYLDAIAWMDGLGVKIQNTRARDYEKTITHWTENYKTASDQVANDELPEFANAALEIDDFVKIYNAFNGFSIEELTSISEKLAIGVAGPTTAAAENSRKTKARNFLFEALVAARCHRPNTGIVSDINTTSDAQLEFEGISIFLECKRINSINKIEANAKDASSQAEARLKKSAKQNRALIAFDITKLFSASGKAHLYDKESDLHNFIKNSVDQFAAKNSKEWEKVYRRRNKRIIGTILRFSHLAINRNTNMLITVHNWSVMERTGTNNTNKQLLARFITALNE